MVVYPIIYRVFYIPGLRWLFRISSINSGDGTFMVMMTDGGLHPNQASFFSTRKQKAAPNGLFLRFPDSNPQFLEDTVFIFKQINQIPFLETISLWVAG